MCVRTVLCTATAHLFAPTLSLPSVVPLLAPHAYIPPSDDPIPPTHTHTKDDSQDLLLSTATAALPFAGVASATTVTLHKYDMTSACAARGQVVVEADNVEPAKKDDPELEEGSCAGAGYTLTQGRSFRYENGSNYVIDYYVSEEGSNAGSTPCVDGQRPVRSGQHQWQLRPRRHQSFPRSQVRILRFLRLRGARGIVHL